MSAQVGTKVESWHGIQNKYKGNDDDDDDDDVDDEDDDQNDHNDGGIGVRVGRGISLWRNRSL
ncbi:hypothetical protein K0M31_007260 [Melipona bicolor]|uniref:Uncharacterized protein n=1 Tax=Melipona bicolor TaxID=60889 RepID=A0AA40GBC8_9HYME|nr:hypothetical protein K0M31_007260 [Melipona bicolor]